LSAWSRRRGEEKGEAGVHLFSVLLDSNPRKKRKNTKREGGGWSQEFLPMRPLRRQEKKKKKGKYRQGEAAAALPWRLEEKEKEKKGGRSDLFSSDWDSG